jgi:hypothetical protein
MAPHRLWIASASIMMVIACEDRSRHPTPESSVATTLTGASATAAVCDSIAAEWTHRDTTASIRRVADTLISERDDPSVYPNALEHHACLTGVRVEHFHPDRLPHGQDPQGIPIWRPGWTQILNMTADGPDGGEQGYTNGAVSCVKRVEFDGEDDSDSTYVPADWYVETTMCWRSRGPRAPSAETQRPMMGTLRPRVSSLNRPGSRSTAAGASARSTVRQRTRPSAIAPHRSRRSTDTAPSDRFDAHVTDSRTRGPGRCSARTSVDYDRTGETTCSGSAP